MGMRKQLTSLAEQRVHARPTSEDEARAALEWVAACEGKTLTELIEELHGAASKERDPRRADP
jgi:hypothetical protein